MAGNKNFPNGRHQLTKEEKLRGVRASVEVRKKKKELRECLQELLKMKYHTDNGVKSGSELLAAAIMNKALDGDVKAFEVVRDTAGEKPVDKIATVTDLVINWGISDDNN